MFENVVGEFPWDVGDHLPEDLDRDLDAELERLLADGAVLPDELVLPFGSCAPSGELALDLDLSTADAAGLSDESLVEAIIGFDRLTSWAAARQARLLDELAARRPADTAPHSARWACVGSEYAPDEVGVALRLSRGGACARIGLARRLLATLPDTHALWESGLIDTSKARAIDDATVVLSDGHATKVEDRRCCPRHRSRPWPSSRPRWLGRSSPPIPRVPRSGTGRRGGTAGWW